MSRYQDVALCTKIDAEGFTIKNLKVPGHAAENVALSILNNIPDGERVLGITPENYPCWPYKVREQFILNRIYTSSTVASKMKPEFVRAILLEEGKKLTGAMICSLGGRLAGVHPDIESEYRARNRLLREVLASLNMKELNRVWKKCVGYWESFLQFCPVTYLPLVMAEINANPDKYSRYKGDTDTPKSLLSTVENRFKEA